MDKVFVTAVGTTFIAFIAWFFFGKREEKEKVASDRHTIVVDGGYKPSTIKIIADRPAKLTFIRKDSNTCLEEILFPDFKIKEYLPLNKPVTIILPPPHEPQSAFHCGMNMFHGKLISMNHD